MSSRRQILRTPSQLYHIKPHQTQVENGLDGTITHIIGPEFVIRSKESPKKISLIKKNNKETKLKKVTIVKLSGQRIEMICNPPSTCISHLFEAMCAEEESCLFPFLGLAKLINGEFHFLPPATKLVKVAPKGWKDAHSNRSTISFDNFTLYLRFISYLKLYSGVPHEKTLTRQLYLQLRHDLIDGRLFPHSSSLLRLASLSLLAEFGHDPLAEEDDYFLLEHFVPQYFLQSSCRSSWDLYRHLRSLHSSLSIRRVSREAARWRFIAEGRKIRHLGAHFHRATEESRGNVWLAGNSEGIYILQEPPSPSSMEKKILFPWQQVKKLSRNSRRMMLHLRTEEGVHKRKFSFKQQQGCAFVFYVFRLLRSRHITSSKDISQIRNRNNNLVDATEARLFPASDRETGNAAQTSPDSVQVSAVPSPARGEREEETKIRVEMGSEGKETTSEQDSISCEGSFRFRRTRACRNWWKKGSSKAVLQTPSSSACSSSCSSGPCEAASLRPLVSFLSVNETTEFRRLVDESFSACESPVQEDGIRKNLNVSLEDSVGASPQGLGTETRTNSALSDNSRDDAYSPFSRNKTVITIATCTSATPTTNTFTTTQKPLTPGIDYTNKASTRSQRTQDAVTVTQMTEEGSGTIRVTRLNSAACTSLSPSHESLQYSPTRTSLGVRMGTRVPNALLNKHKFLVGIESPPPGTPSKKNEIFTLSPVVVEPEATPSEELNESVNESLLWRFLKAPTMAGSTERRLETVKLTKKNGLLGIVLGLGSDKALYIQRITPGGAAEQQGTLKPGDRLVGVNGLCVDSLSYGQTIDLLRSAADEVCILVSQPIGRIAQGSDFSDPATFNPVEELGSGTKGNYITVIPITPEAEQISKPKVVAKRLQFLYQGEV